MERYLACLSFWQFGGSAEICSMAGQTDFFRASREDWITTYAHRKSRDAVA